MDPVHNSPRGDLYITWGVGEWAGISGVLVPLKVSLDTYTRKKTILIRALLKH